MSFFRNIFGRAPILPNTTISTGGLFSFLFKSDGSVGSVNSDSALRHTAVYSCVQAITDSLAVVSLNLYERKDGGKTKATQHPLYRILKFSPNEMHTRFDYIRMVYQDILLRGNHYSQIVRNGKNEIIGLYPLHPDNMQVKIRQNGKIVYIYKKGDKQYALLQNEIFHLKGLPNPDDRGLTGVNPIEYNRKSIKLSMVTEQFGINFFENGANGTGVLTHPGTLSDEAFERLRKSFKEKYQGVKNSGKPLILEENMKYERLSLSNEDSQFLDTRRFQKAEIAALFKVPLYMLGDMSKSTFNNMEQMSINFVQNTLLPHAVNFELAVYKYLLNEDEKDKYYAKFNLNTLMRGDFETRTNGYRTLVNIGALTPNEVRKLEDFDLKGNEADELYMQMNMTTLKRITNGKN